VVLTVLASLFVSLTIVPFLSSRILAEHHDPRGNIFLRGLKWLISGTYAKVLHPGLAWPRVTMLAAGIIFFTVLGLAGKAGFALFPASERPMFYIDVEMAAGTSLEQTDGTVQMVDSVLNEYTAPGFGSSEFGMRNAMLTSLKPNESPIPNHESPITNPQYSGGKAKVTWYASNVGRGNPRIYYNVIREKEAADYGQIFVQLEDRTPPPVKIAMLDELREKFKNVPGAVINVKNFEQGPPIEAPIVIRTFGENLDTLRRLAGQVETIISETEGTMYVDNPISTVKTDLQVKINKDKAATLGIPVAETERMVRLAIAGLNVGNFTAAADGEEYNLTVSVPKDGTFANLDALKNLYINNVLGTAIPLSQVAEIQFKPSPNFIQHYDKDRFTSVTAFVKSGHFAAEINGKIKEKLQAMTFPAGYSYVVAGEEESAKRSFGGLGTIIMVTIFGLLAVLILEFKTFRSTVIVLSVIPLGIIGAILILLATGYPFSFTVVVGLIALMGIEVKNSILLVDFTNQLRAEGRSLDEAIQEAGEIRFVPILLTSLTAIGGLLPIAIEENPLYSPLSYVLIGGLISSTLLSRIVTPVLYKLLAPRVV
ncbi:MAG TPA: efflux RND transporter permease subunit, partial [Saprospiraceae bacterium]|nr:efflux RND transporter permease subunit [Saprospiraceae bacterium]